MHWSLNTIYPINKILKTDFVNDQLLLWTDDNGKVCNVQYNHNIHLIKENLLDEGLKENN